MTAKQKNLDFRRWVLLGWLQFIWFLRKRCGIRAYGIGFMAARVKLPFDFLFRGARFCFYPPAARSYCLLPAGIANEPETHKFLARVLRGRKDVTFVDVGASIGEFAIPMAADERVAAVIAFEPHPVTCEALRHSVSYLPRGIVRVIEAGVSATSGSAQFGTRDGAPTSAGLTMTCDSDQLTVATCTLDDLPDVAPESPVILLMDIEGGELDAAKGAQQFLARHRPLFIFEYNATTRRSFELSEMVSLLGSQYSLHRLRSVDGLLDDDLSNTWNIVALPSNGPWAMLKEDAVLFAR